MKSSAWIWRITASVSVIVTIVLIIGFMYAFKDINDPQGQPLLTGGGSEASKKRQRRSDRGAIRHNRFCPMI